MPKNPNIVIAADAEGIILNLSIPLAKEILGALDAHIEAMFSPSLRAAKDELRKAVIKAEKEEGK